MLFDSSRQFTKDVLIAFRLDDTPGFSVIRRVDGLNISYQSLFVEEFQVEVGMNGMEWNMDPGQLGLSLIFPIEVIPDFFQSVRVPVFRKALVNQFMNQRIDKVVRRSAING